MMHTEFILCPICKNKTRLKMREDTILENFPLFCPKCRQETLISVKQLKSQYAKSQTHRRRADELMRIETSQLIGSILLYSMGKTSPPNKKTVLLVGGFVMPR